MYRIVLIDSRKKRDGEYLDLLGTYDAFNKNINLDLDKYKNYLSKGAQPTDVVKKLYEQVNDKENNE